MATSRVAAKTELTRLIADAMPDAALVREGLPTDQPTRAQGERVYVWRRLEDGVRENRVQQGADETYTIRVLIEVRTYMVSDPDGGDSEARAEAILALIDGVLEDDPSLGGNVMDAAVQTFDSDTGPHEDDDGWITKALVGIRAGGFIEIA